MGPKGPRPVLRGDLRGVKTSIPLNHQEKHAEDLRVGVRSIAVIVGSIFGPVFQVELKFLVLLGVKVLWELQAGEGCGDSHLGSRISRHQVGFQGTDETLVPQWEEGPGLIASPPVAGKGAPEGACRR